MKASHRRKEGVIKKTFASLQIEAKVYLFLASIFGVLFIIVTPPLKSPDEPQHYFRSYEISSLHLVSNKYSDGRYGYAIPDNVARFGETSLIREEQHQPPDTQLLKKLATEHYDTKKLPVRFDNSAVYSPIGYVFSAAGIGISRIFNMSVLSGYYLGRALNLFLWILLVVIAIKICPFGKWIIASVSLLPMTIFQAASFSPDALMNGLSSLVIAYFLYLQCQKSLNSRHLLFAVLLLSLISLSKQVYFLLFFPFLFLPYIKFKSKYYYITWILLITTVPLFFCLIWLRVSWGISSKIAVMFQLGNNVSATSQVAYIFHHPFNFAYTVLHTLLFTQSDYLTKGVLGLLGWATISLPTYIYLLIAVTLCLAVLYSAKTGSISILNVKLRIVLTGTALLVILGICASLYLSFTTVGANEIRGLQGRYFIPVLLLLLPVLVTKRFYIQSSPRYFSIVFILLNSITLLFSLFYILHNTYLHT